MPTYFQSVVLSLKCFSPNNLSKAKLSKLKGVLYMKVKLVYMKVKFRVANFRSLQTCCV